MENSNTFYDRLLRDQFNEEEQLDIVSKDPCLIMHMHDASIKVQEVAIRKDPNVIRHIRDQSEYIKMVAINQGCLLKYIKEPDYTIIYEAIDINPINIVYVNYNSISFDGSLLTLAIHRGAIAMFIKSLETNDCDKNKAVLESLVNKQNYNFQKENSKNCTIS